MPERRLTARTVIACQSRSHAGLLLQVLALPPGDVLFVVESRELERWLKRRGLRVHRASFRDRAAWREVLPAGQLVIALKDPRRLRSTLEAVRRERGDTPVLVLSLHPPEELPVDPATWPWAYVSFAGERFQPAFRTDARLARAKILVRRLREILDDAKSILVLLQDDPDPDGLACGLALRMLLGRTKVSMPLGSFGQVTRPENRAMTEILDLDVLQVGMDDLEKFDRIVMVDTQPPHLRQQLPRVDVVIDHHPVQTSYEARFKDVRNSYGATATILLEYLRAERVKVSERLATGLLYAIRTDTLLLDRPVTEADVEAFTWLFPRANTNWIRRIERPSLPRETLDAFADGLRGARIEDEVIFSHLGDVAREDVIPQLADFCLQVEGVDWSVVSGVFGGELIVSIRNVGFVQAAGTVVKAAWASMGPCGGHRSMAKAILPLENLPHVRKGRPTEKTYRALEELFLAALRRDRE